MASEVKAPMIGETFLLDRTFVRREVRAAVRTFFSPFRGLAEAARGIDETPPDTAPENMSLRTMRLGIMESDGARHYYITISNPSGDQSHMVEPILGERGEVSLVLGEEIGRIPTSPSGASRAAGRRVPGKKQTFSKMP